MAIFIGALGVAFAAFCVWLGVRIVNRRERWAKWTAAGLAIALPVIYLLGLGPAQWLISRHMLSESAVYHITSFYGPMNSFYDIAPPAIRDGIDWYLDLWEP